MLTDQIRSIYVDFQQDGATTHKRRNNGSIASASSGCVISREERSCNRLRRVIRTARLFPKHEGVKIDIIKGKNTISKGEEQKQQQK